MIAIKVYYHKYKKKYEKNRDRKMFKKKKFLLNNLFHYIKLNK